MSREIKRGMIFRNATGLKCHVANVFNEGDLEVVTYRFWVKHKSYWVFKTDFKEIFLIGFEYNWEWETKELLNQG